MKLTYMRGALAALVAAVTVGALVTAQAANAEKWYVQKTTTEGQLTSVTCASEFSCTAVGWKPGTFETKSTNYALLESWNNLNEWAPKAVPEPAKAEESKFLGVSCDLHCTAVGYDVVKGAAAPLAEQNNGTEWVIQPTPVTAGKLEAVSCLESMCTAVGTKEGKALVEHWNEKEWSVQSTPALGESSAFHAVSCIAKACFAAGTVTEAGVVVPLWEKWNGKEWTRSTSPITPEGAKNIMITGIACQGGPGGGVAPCDLVGSYRREVKPKTIARVGLAEHWNTLTLKWELGSTPTPEGAAEEWSFSGVACSGDEHRCDAVGHLENTHEDFLTLAESWNTEVWKLQSTPNEETQRDNFFNGVSCPNREVCVAVGATDVVKEHLVYHTLVERYEESAG
jgi:hypothetical protein